MQCFEGHGATAEDAEAAGVGNRSGEFGTGGRPDAGVEDRIWNSQKVANRGPESRRHHFIVVPQRPFEKVGD
jgi:hypothetical protein